MHISITYTFGLRLKQYLHVAGNKRFIIIENVCVYTKAISEEPERRGVLNIDANSNAYTNLGGRLKYLLLARKKDYDVVQAVNFVGSKLAFSESAAGRATVGF